MELINKGGIFIWPILAMSAAALYFIVERIVFFAVTMPKYRRSLEHACASDDGEAERMNLDDDDPLIAEILLAREERELHLESVSLALEKHLENAQHNLTALNIIAQTAPLLGLLGTVTGMIQAFVRIQNLQGQVNPGDLAGGIWEAMITTAAGMTVAIPALIAYMFFASRVAKYETWLSLAITRVEKLFKRRDWGVF